MSYHSSRKPRRISRLSPWKIIEGQGNLTDELRSLTIKLGEELVAYITGVSLGTLNNWLTKVGRPNGAQGMRIRVAKMVWAELSKTEDDSTIRAWFIGIGDSIDNYAPADMLSRGDLVGFKLAADMMIEDD